MILLMGSNQSKSNCRPRLLCDLLTILQQCDVMRRTWRRKKSTSVGFPTTQSPMKTNYSLLHVKVWSLSPSQIPKTSRKAGREFRSARAAERDEKKNSTNASTDAPAMLLCRKRPDGFTSLSCRSLQWRSSPHSTADTEDLPSNSAVESLLP